MVPDARHFSRFWLFSDSGMLVDQSCTALFTLEVKNINMIHLASDMVEIYRVFVNTPPDKLLLGLSSPFLGFGVLVLVRWRVGDSALLAGDFVCEALLSFGGRFGPEGGVVFGGAGGRCAARELTGF
jgi:hypothetical protein